MPHALLLTLLFATSVAADPSTPADKNQPGRDLLFSTTPRAPARTTYGGSPTNACASSDACKAAALAKDLAWGSAGSYQTKGCYFYPKESGSTYAGKAYYGTRTNAAEAPLTGGPKLRLLCKAVEAARREAERQARRDEKLLAWREELLGWREKGPSPRDLERLEQYGDAYAADLKRAGFNAFDLKAACFSAAELEAAGFSAAEVLEAEKHGRVLDEMCRACQTILCRVNRGEEKRGAGHYLVQS